MEYRFFYSIDECVFNTKWKTKSNIENRTDIYFTIPIALNGSDEFHIEHGLKLRNRRTLELKVREKRYSNGQEFWLKTIHSNTKLHIDNIDSIVKVLNKLNENKLIERLKSSQPIIVCYVSKFRQQKNLEGNLIQEITGLHLKFIQLNDQSQIGKDLFFETVCIERSDSKLIDEKCIENLFQEYRTMTINPMGYPEFLFQQYQQVMNQ
ncbi:unnamed protein product [Rotaria socialis]|uniref:CYTH domain-containing protein n=1 Tax=Rotaria socialis TaxID=392032 RepID=A0A817Y9I1_9BILA|nr:unnamed protein product [Rotaria socialis]CAF4515140.1 unnamed protein product [Rotaria socialis]